MIYVYRAIMSISDFGKAKKRLRCATESADKPATVRGIWTDQTYASDHDITVFGLHASQSAD